MWVYLLKIILKIWGFIMSVSNGEKGDQTVFNSSFMSREVDTNTTGKVDLENADGASGSSVFNAQKSLNGQASFSGANVNGLENQKPAFATDNTGSPGDDLKQRVDAVQAKSEAALAAASVSPTKLYRIYGGGTVAWTDTPGYTNVNSYDATAANATARITYNATYHNQTNNISAFCWFKTGNNGFATMMSHYDLVSFPANVKWSLMKETDVYEIRVVAAGGNRKRYQYGGTIPHDNQWHHYGFTFSSNVFKMYIDGSEIPGGSLTKLDDDVVNSVQSINRDLMIGSMLNNNNPSGALIGLLDECTYWDKELSGAEVTELYNGGATFDLTTHSASANLISWYKIDGDTLPTVTDAINGQDAAADVNAALSVDVVAGSAGFSGLSFDDDFVVEVPGLDYSDNVIPSSESPISLSSDLDVAYVTPNLSAPGGNLSVTVDTLDNVPVGGLVVARRIDDSVSVVRVEGLRLEDGESGKI